MPSFSVLRLRDFRILLITRIFGALALQAQDVIIGWQVYSMTRDPFMLGLVGLTEAIPALACALIAGHIVDISRPYRVFIICMGVLSLNMLLLYLIAGGTLPVASVLPWIFAGVFVSGLARSFIMPSTFSLIPQVVPRESIPAASAWSTGGFQVGIILGPAAAGIIYGAYGPHVAWTIPVSLMIVSFLMICGLSAPHRSFRGSSRREPAVASIKAGWRFMFQTPVLLAAMALDMFAVLFGGAVAMLPAVADQVLHIGSEGLGILRTAPAIGAILTTLYFAVRPLKDMRGKLMLWMVAAFGISIIGFGLSQHFWLSFAFLAASGAVDSISMIIRFTLVQWLTPEEMRGRVASVNSMFIISSNEIGAFESGFAAKLFGLVPSIIFGGVCTLGVVAITALLCPQLRRAVVTPQAQAKAG